MKKHFTYTTQGIVLIVLINLLTLTYSCSKNTGEEHLDIDGSATLEFAISSIIDPEESEIPQASNIQSKRSDKKVRTSTSLIKGKIASVGTIEEHTVIDGLFDAVITLENKRDPVASSVREKHSVNNQASSSTNPSLIAETMPSGMRYRVLIYTNTDQYVGAIDATSGTQIAVPFPVNQQTTYRWYAYSYNSTTQAPLPSNTATPTVSTAAGMTDLLHASGTITTVAGSNKINIQFDRKLAVVKVRLDGRGMFSPITSVTGSYSTATANAIRGAGILNIKSGNYESTSGAAPAALTWVNEATATGDTVKMAYIYTPGTLSINGLTITISNLQLRLDNNTTRTFTNRSFTFNTPFTPSLGNRYTVNITLRESAVTVGGVQWARANLYYRPEDNGYRFRQQSSNIYGTASNPTASNEYWNWRSARPGPSEATDVVDPCTLVFPAGTWRMPTQANMVSLQNVTNIRSFGESDSPIVRYVAWTVGANNEYGINWTSWLSFGYRAQNSNSIVNYTAGSTYNGYWWTSTSASATSTSYLAVQYTSSTAGTITTNQNAQARNFGLNIRCVR